MTPPNLLLPHHCASEAQVSDPFPEPDATVEVSVGLPGDWKDADVLLRTVVDGEAAYLEPLPAREGSTDRRFTLTCDQPVQHYRFHLRVGSDGYWLNGLGLLDWDPDDYYDFKLTPGLRPPSWVSERVWYQIFPDRFATTGRHRVDQDWIRWADWGDPIERSFPASMTQLYGGDLDGIAQRLDHLTDLGIGGVYLTPIFPARSNHRYDATTFDRVDPILGGDDALVRLRDATAGRGMRLMTDLTLNHTGDAHEWFVRAKADPESDERHFYYFVDYPLTYETWLGVDSLPKLDHRSSELALRFYAGADSVVAGYLGTPFDLDGWRIDVANMTGRLGRLDLNHEVARAVRRTVDDSGPDKWLVGEHFFDAAPDAPGDGWHGVMNYAGISRPIASWLGKPLTLHGMSAGPGQDLRGGPAMVRAMDVVRGAMPWSVTMGSMSLLSSHDTARWRSMCRSDSHALVGFGMLMTLPGAPCFFYGDEIGLTGDDNEESRAPMPWDEPSAWDQRFLDWFRTLIDVRNGSPAAQRGGMRWLHVDDDQIVFTRTAVDAAILVRAARDATERVELDLSSIGYDLAVPLVSWTGDETGARGTVLLPGDGPRLDIWALS